MTTVCFDVDGTLIGIDNRPRWEVIQLFHMLNLIGCDVFIWSGGGIDYATMIRDRLGLKAKIIEKGSMVPDISVDDQEVTLGRANICVGGLTSLY